MNADNILEDIATHHICDEVESLMGDPREIVGDMSYDEFVDWLGECPTDERPEDVVEQAIPHFEKWNMPNHVAIMKTYVKRARM